MPAAIKNSADRTPARLGYAWIFYFFLAGRIILAAADTGASPCAACHRAQALSQPSTSMARALERVAGSEILRSNPLLTFREGAFTFRITREGDRSIYSVARGSETVSEPIAYAFGLGSAGQTYVYQRNGNWYEARVSFYKAIGGLDLTLGHASIEPHNLEEAAGREIGPQEAVDCFGCHATHASIGGKLQLESLVPGVQCERCHGLAEKHQAAVKSGDAKNASMPRLGELTAEEMSDFCGQCHRTWSQIAMKGPHDINNVRFQPYRMTNSRCYDVADLRISCVACHDPHREVERGAAFYDAKCTACHGAAVKRERNAATCPKATTNCTSCHMPKLEIPGAHNVFTDHQIRVVKPGELYPS